MRILLVFVCVLSCAHVTSAKEETEEKECRVHKDIVTPAALKAQLPADADTLEVYMLQA